MSRPVGKTIRAEWWDDDESVTFRTALTLLESQRLDELRLSVQTAFDSMSEDREKAQIAATGLAELVLLSVQPSKFKLHPIDSEPGADGIKPWVAANVEEIRDLPLQDLFYIARRGEDPAPPASQDEEPRAAAATFPTGSDEHPVLNGAGAPTLQTAV